MLAWFPVKAAHSYFWITKTSRRVCFREWILFLTCSKNRCEFFPFVSSFSSSCSARHILNTSAQPQLTASECSQPRFRSSGKVEEKEGIARRLSPDRQNELRNERTSVRSCFLLSLSSLFPLSLSSHFALSRGEGE